MVVIIDNRWECAILKVTRYYFVVPNSNYGKGDRSMKHVGKYFREHIQLLYTVMTVIFCAVKGYFVAPSTDTDFLITLALVIVILVNAYTLLIRKQHGAHNIIPYATIDIIFVNRLYSYDRLKLLCPAIGTIDPLWLAAGLTCLAIIVMVVVKLVPNLSNEDAGKSAATDESRRTAEHTPSCAVGQVHQGQNKEAEPYKSSLHPLWILLILVCIFTFTFLTLHLIVETGSVAPFNLFDTVTYLIAYSAAILVVLLAVGLTVTVIIELIRFIYSRIWIPRISETRQNSTPPLYVFSFIIVAVLFYLSFKISNFTMDDFTEIISGGEYLALPLTILVIVTAFCVLVRITHGVILMVMDMDAKEIRNFFSRTAKSICLNDTIVSISNTLVGIVLGTIDLALKFAKFIPDFFESLYHFVFEDESEGDDINVESAP